MSSPSSESISTRSTSLRPCMPAASGSSTDDAGGSVTGVIADFLIIVYSPSHHDGSIHDVDDSYTWANALGEFIPALNTAEFAGHDDWRLPNVKELQSIVNYGAVSPAVSAAFDTGCAADCTVLTCSCTASTFSYWSSTAFEGDSLAAWKVSFRFGNVLTEDKLFFIPRVRAVRGGSLPTP